MSRYDHPEFIEEFCATCNKLTFFRYIQTDLPSYRCTQCRAHIPEESGVATKIRWSQVNAIKVTEKGIQFFMDSGKYFTEWGLKRELPLPVVQVKSIIIDNYNRIQAHTPTQFQLAGSKMLCRGNDFPDFWDVWREFKPQLKTIGVFVELSNPYAHMSKDYVIGVLVTTVMSWVAQPNVTNEKEELISQIIEQDRLKAYKRERFHYQQFDRLVQTYLGRYGTTDICIMVSGIYESTRTFETQSEMDQHFSYYQFFMFKFRNIEYACSILPFTWVTAYFPQLKPTAGLPCKDAETALKILKMKEMGEI